METYECFLPWLYKNGGYWEISAELFFYVGDGFPIGPTKDACWGSSSIWASTFSWLVIQDASRKFCLPFQEPVPWGVMITYTNEVFRGLVSRDRWYKMSQLIYELQGME